MLRLREAGYLTVSGVAKALGIGTTTLRRREGTLYPRAARIGGIRVYHEADSTVKGGRRGIALARSTPATASYSKDGLPSGQPTLTHHFQGSEPWTS